MDDMNDSGCWAKGSRCYEQLKALDDMSDSRLWAQGSRCYEQLRAVDDIATQGCELRALDATSSAGLWLTWTTSSHDLKA